MLTIYRDLIRRYIASSQRQAMSLLTGRLCKVLLCIDNYFGVFASCVVLSISLYYRIYHIRLRRLHQHRSIMFTAVRSSSCLNRSVRDRPIKIEPTRDICYGVVAKASIVVVTQLIRISLRLQEVTHSTKPIGTVTTSTTSDCVEREDSIVQSHSDELVGSVVRVVAVLCGAGVCASVLDRRGIFNTTPNDLGDKFCGEGGQVTEDEVSIWIGRILC